MNKILASFASILLTSTLIQSADVDVQSVTSSDWTVDTPNSINSRNILLLADFEYVNEEETLLLESLLLDNIDTTKQSLKTVFNISNIWELWVKSDLLYTTVIVPPLTWTLIVDTDKFNQFSDKLSAIQQTRLDILNAMELSNLYLYFFH